ncbi:hypothetical protein BXZ70DRAFT_1009203 [Cristinia sonorae]|uniref:DNA replication regulator SLD2 n=1 Tax=Cristinia sonorae TaxID=1940300 RepID=A0A8K0XPC6_9AGAR|nr:hypothetical protein BXZ70DRAFT_1009203 [Cristinia sonorae]
MDVAALRTEIKAWEHAFRATHARDPAIQDIRDQPPIAEKYRLYKKLSKANKPAARPSTPPKPHSILPKSRAVKTSAPPESSNPFSPLKNKGKQRDFSPPPTPSRSVTVPSRSNPFATPSKDKFRPRLRVPREPSPDPFPLASNAQQSSLSATPNQKTAVSRARKRLRGDPVSPSPVKEKRPRVASQSALAFAKHLHPEQVPEVLARDDDDDEPFIDDSPVKQSSGKAYLPLFAESSTSQSARPLARTQSKVTVEVSSSVGRVRSRALSPASDEEEMDWVQKGKLKALDVSLRSLKPDAGFKSKSQTSSLGLAAARLSLSGTQRTSISAQSIDPATNDVAQPSLIPPSPPPNHSHRSTNPKYMDKPKGKGKALAKAKAKGKEVEEDSDSPEDEELDVHVITRKRRPAAGEEGDSLPLEEDWDPLVSRPGRDESTLIPPESPSKIEVSLPEELKRVLAISADDIKVKDTTEENLVKELVYGSRVMQYDPRKGGLIWDVGEEEETDVKANGDEDEWEGEPVPWEVGEL